MSSENLLYGGLFSQVHMYGIEDSAKTGRNGAMFKEIFHEGIWRAMDFLSNTLRSSFYSATEDVSRFAISGLKLANLFRKSDNSALPTAEDGDLIGALGMWNLKKQKEQQKSVVIKKGKEKEDIKKKSTTYATWKFTSDQNSISSLRKVQSCEEFQVLTY